MHAGTCSAERLVVRVFMLGEHLTRRRRQPLAQSGGEHGEPRLELMECVASGAAHVCARVGERADDRVTNRRGVCMQGFGRVGSQR
eukprot:2274553-Pleurochrysis_carterae.AAC.1